MNIGKYFRYNGWAFSPGTRPKLHKQLNSELGALGVRGYYKLYNILGDCNMHEQLNRVACMLALVDGNLIGNEAPAREQPASVIVSHSATTFINMRSQSLRRYPRANPPCGLLWIVVNFVGDPSGHHKLPQLNSYKRDYKKLTKLFVGELHYKMFYDESLPDRAPWFNRTGQVSGKSVRLNAISKCASALASSVHA